MIIMSQPNWSFSFLWHDDGYDYDYEDGDSGENQDDEDDDFSANINDVHQTLERPLGHK